MRNPGIAAVAALCGGVIALGGMSCFSDDEYGFHSIARPLHVTVDDLGWQGGSTLQEISGPFRCGIDEDHDLSRYEDLLKVAKGTKSRLLGVFILSELDRNGICAKPEYNMPLAPSDMTEFGLAWNNSAYIDDSNTVFMQWVRDNAAWLEFGMHGVRHEHWENGVLTRAEYARHSDQTSWGWQDMNNHAECFEELMRQYYTVDQCSFPVNFVPPDHDYYYDENSDETTGALLGSYGIKYAQYLRDDMVDHDVFCIRRDVGLSPRYLTKGQTPRGYAPDVPWQISHFTNYFDATTTWIDWLNRINDDPDRYLPKNSIQLSGQHLYFKYATIRDHNRVMSIDNTAMIPAAYDKSLLGTLVLKTRLPEDLHVSRADLDGGAMVTGYWEDGYGYAYLVIADCDNPMGRLDRQIYTMSWEFGEQLLYPCIDLTNSTFNPLGMVDENGQTIMKLQLFGTQDIVMRFPGHGIVRAVTSMSQGIGIQAWKQDDHARVLTITASAMDMQGETGEIKIEYDARQRIF